MNVATLGQGAKVLELILQKETPVAQMQDLLKRGLLADLLDANVGSVDREDFRKLLGLGNLMPDLMELTGVALPEKKRTLTDRIKDGGYDWVNGDITEERFPLTLPAGPRKLFLAHYNKVMNGKKVDEWASKNGYKVGLTDDLLAVGCHPEYKDLQRKFPIIALGSPAVIPGPRRVPYLDGSDAERRLYLYWNVHDVGDSCRFLLFREEPLDTGALGT